MKKIFTQMFNKMIRRGSGVNLLRYAAMVLVLFVLGIGNAWADTHYYAQLQTKVATNSNAGGKVYASTSSSAPDANSYGADVSSDKQDSKNESGGAKTFYAFAQANEGYSFTGWYTGDNGTDDYLGNESPLTVQVNASTTGDGTNTKTIYATFAENQAISVTFVPGTNGSYTVNGTKITASQSVTCEGTTSLVATASSGYKFFGWYTSDDGGTTRSYFSYSATASQTFLSATTVYADFIPNTTAVFIRDANEAVRYKSLSEALAGFTSGVISVYQNGTVPAGNYTIPKNVTLLVPYDAAYTNLSKPTDVQTWANLSEFRRLSLAAGANIIVNGSLCVGGRQWGTSSNNPGPGSVLGSYGVLDMSAGGHVSIEDKGVLHAYGFIIGKGDQSQSGTITIKNGGVVYEDIAINDLHGGGGTAACINGTKAKNDYELFVFNQYFVQNVEPKMTIEYGGSEIVYYDIQSSQGGDQGTANLIGKETSFLFQLSSGASITKWYDVTRDYQCYEVRGSLSMNGISIDAVVTTLSSTKFVLPLNNNMEITAKNGSTLNLPYSIKFQAGAGLIIEEGATVNVSKDLYFYDYQDWDKFGCGYAQTFGTTASGKKLSWHTLRDVSTPSKLGHAKLVVNGTLNVNSGGALYTTSHGGSITSEGTGKIVFNAAGPTNNKNLYEIWSTYGKRNDGAGLAQGETNAAEGQVLVGSYSFLGKKYYIYGTPVECTPAQLLNSTAFKETYGDDFTYLATSGTDASTTINYRNGHWGWMEIWKDEDGTILKAINTTTQQSGEAPSNLTKGCYTFMGWSTVTSTDNQEVIHTANYSDTPITYTITYSTGSNGSGTVDNGTKNCGEDFTLSSSTFKRDAYYQTGWSTTDGGEKAYDLGGSYTVNDDITLYPFWTPYVASVTVEGEVPTYYTTILSAIGAANGTSNAVVTMLDNVTITSEIEITKSMTIDLNGKTISSTQTTADKGVFKVNASDKTVTITDSGTDGKIEHTANCTDYLYGINLAAGSLNIEGGIISATNNAAANNAYRAIGIWTEGSAAGITMSGNCTVSAVGKNMVFGIYDNKGCPITMAGGTVTASGTTSIRGIYIKGTTTLTDATITATATGSNSIAIFGNQNINLTIHSGTYTATGTGDSYAISERSGINITINGGRFSGATKELKEESGTTTIKGGVYAHNTRIEDKCATNYHVLPNADASYPYKVVEAYTITWKDMALPGDHVIKTEVLEKGAQPVFNYQKNNSETEFFIFRGWHAEGAGILVPTPIPTVTCDDTYVAIYDAKPLDMVVADEQTIPASVSIRTTTVRVSGRLNISNGATLTTKDLVLEASSTGSGSIPDIENVNVTGDVYFDYTPNGDGGTDSRTWYAVGVPWKVDADEGISIKDGRKLIFGRDFDVLYYDGVERMNQGKHTASCWRWVEDDRDNGTGDGSVLIPGRMYMIHLVPNVKTIRFKKMSGETIINDNIAFIATGEDGLQANWNGIANPAAYIADISFSAGVTLAQVYSGTINNDHWEPTPINEIDFTVGKAVAVQLPQATPGVSITKHGASSAPARRYGVHLAEPEFYEVSVADNSGKITDRLFISATDDEKENRYIIGKDLAKMGIASAVPQIWINRYDAKLCLNTITRVNNMAEYPLQVVVPAAGDYTIESPVTLSNDETLYLTYNGYAIWDLSKSAYSVWLPKGAITQYGLRLVRQQPGTVTSMDEATVGNSKEVRKVVIDEHVYIIRDGKVYSVDGQLVSE